MRGDVSHSLDEPFHIYQCLVLFGDGNAWNHLLLHSGIAAAQIQAVDDVVELLTRSRHAVASVKPQTPVRPCLSWVPT
jgi:hypothetical protein